MKPVDLNLSSTPFRNDTPIVAGLVLLALLAFGFTGWNAYSWFTADRKEAQIQEAMAGHKREMARKNAESARLTKELEEIDRVRLLSQAEFVAAVLEERNFSWTRLFNNLETVLPWNVRVTTIRPQIKDGEIHLLISGVAQDTDGFFAVQEGFLNSGVFGSVTPHGFEKAEADQRIFFELEVSYFPKKELTPPMTLEQEAEAPSDETVPPVPVPSRAVAAPPAAGPRPGSVKGGR